MQVRSASQEALLGQLVAQAGTVDPKHQEGLRRCFEKKYTQHVSMVQYNRLREDRFALSQQKVLEQEQDQLGKAKEYISLRQSKATQIKNTGLIEKSRRVQEDLARWEKRVERNRIEHQRRIEESLRILQDWNHSLPISPPQRSPRGNPGSPAKPSSPRPQPSARIQGGEEGRAAERIRIKEGRLRQEIAQISARKSLRVSTESLQQRQQKRQKKEGQLLEKSLAETGAKQERINEARYMKHYMLERKRKLRAEKEELLRRQREKNIHDLREDLQARNDQLDKKFKKEKSKPRRQRASLPLISGNSSEDPLKLPGQEWRHPRIGSPRESKPVVFRERQRTMEPSYSRMVVQKLRDVAMLVRMAK